LAEPTAQDWAINRLDCRTTTSGSPASRRSRGNRRRILIWRLIMVADFAGGATLVVYLLLGSLFRVPPFT
jgi:hypothetical protein